MTNMKIAMATTRAPKNHAKFSTTHPCMVVPTSLMPVGETTAQMKTARENVSATAKTILLVGNFAPVSATLMPGTSARWMDRSPRVAFSSALGMRLLGGTWGGHVSILRL